MLQIYLGFVCGPDKMHIYIGRLVDTLFFGRPVSMFVVGGQAEARPLWRARCAPVRCLLGCGLRHSAASNYESEPWSILSTGPSQHFYTRPDTGYLESAWTVDRDIMGRGLGTWFLRYVGTICCLHVEHRPIPSSAALGAWLIWLKPVSWSNLFEVYRQ